MRQVHWSEVTPQPFLRAPSREMLTEQGLHVVQTAGARNSRIPYESREQIAVIYDSSYVAAYFNNAFTRLGLPLLSHEHYLEHFKQGLNPLLSTESEDTTENEYKAFYESVHDELSTFTAMLPNANLGSRNPSDYPVRYHHAVKLLERLENLCQIEFKGKQWTESEVKQRLGRM